MENKNSKCVIYMYVKHPKTLLQSSRRCSGFSREILRTESTVVNLCSFSPVALKVCQGANTNTGRELLTEAINLYSSIYHCIQSLTTTGAGPRFKGLLFLTWKTNRRFWDCLKCHLGILDLYCVRFDNSQ